MKVSSKTLVFVVALSSLLVVGAYLSWSNVKASTTKAEAKKPSAESVQYLFTNSGIRLGTEKSPLEITEVKSKGAAISVGQVVLGDADWLDGVEVKLRNSSKEEIKAAQLRVDLLDPQTNAIIASMPGLVVNAKLAPQQEQTGRVLLYAIASLRQSIAASGLPFQRVVVQVDLVELANGTSWKYGLLHSQDPNDPNRWVPILAQKQSWTPNNRRNVGDNDVVVVKASLRNGAFVCDKYFYGYLAGHYCSECGCIVYDEDWRFTPNGLGPATAGYIPYYCGSCQCSKIGLIEWCG